MQKKAIAIALCATLAVAATGGAVYAQVVPQGPTRAEFQEHAAMAFDRLDANVDGQIDGADRGDARAERIRARFDAADTNRDGALAFEEYSAARDDARSQFADGWRGGDRPNGDMRGGDRRGGDRLGDRHERRGHAGMGRDGLPGMGMMALAATADANADQAISQAEYTTAVLAFFDSADANDDGVMTSEEARTRRQIMRGQAQAARSQARTAPATSAN